MACFQLRHMCFTAVLLSAAFSFCTGQGGGSGGGGGGGGSSIGAVVPGTQDSVQIVAQAALCFDNRPVLNGCLKAMGINGTGTGPNMPPPPGSTAVMCSAPCFGHVTMMMSCVNSIFGNFVSYNPGLMQGVQAIFQMSCGNVNGQGGPGGPAGQGGSAGGVGSAGGANGGVRGGSGTTANGVGGGAAAGGGGMGATNSIGGPAGGSGGGAAAGGGGMGTSTTNSIGGGAAGGTSVGAAGGNGTTTGGGAVSAIGSINGTNVSANAGSHVAVSSPGQLASSVDGPTFSLKGVVLVIWAGSCLLLF
ncbi:glycine-rich cell wall structural protein 1 [Brachypodium distachyon]|uniref:DUF7731 domain-containing protein n=1 Tax=Brachypodium distachyon TaxID=15368 RepID=A0A0Q3QZZ9_BRADI|nr:glycine-rich cell wall structural protein 1 [Brachypodium distachyon]KQK06746.1 hypothetical protein BRADI_2g28150v3 [Brachypodium distachyon]|eukprot:XP_014754581.1 glycine-rich cell wall structural protein 1 [Brachypodium distachyon]